MCCYGASDSYVMTELEVCGRAAAPLLEKKKNKKRYETLGALVAESRTTSMIQCMHAIGLLFSFTHELQSCGSCLLRSLAETLHNNFPGAVLNLLEQFQAVEGENPFGSMRSKPSVQLAGVGAGEGGYWWGRGL